MDGRGLTIALELAFVAGALPGCSEASGTDIDTVRTRRGSESDGGPGSRVVADSQTSRATTDSPSSGLDDGTTERTPSDARPRPSDLPEPSCPNLAERETRELLGELAEDATWTCDVRYLLRGVVRVSGQSTLTIEAGTLIEGDYIGALVIERGSRLVVRGTARNPVVFTSSAVTGSRHAGDWQGVVLLGGAPLNTENGDASQLEMSSADGVFGGSDETHDCGSLRYLRVEFAGAAPVFENSWGALVFAGCGSQTVVDHVQVHRSNGDGLGLVGGGFDMRYVLITEALDDSIDWTRGFHGKGQFIAVRQDPEQGGNSGFEGDNWNDAPSAVPRALPTFYNFTIVGAQARSGHAVVLRQGSWGTFANGILTNAGLGAVDVRGAESVSGAAADPPRLVVQSSLFFRNGADGSSHFPVESNGVEDDDDGFDEAAFFSMASMGNRFGTDPLLVDPEDPTEPSLVPRVANPELNGMTPPDDGFFDVTARYKGAFEPAAPAWTLGWTASPRQ